MVGERAEKFAEIRASQVQNPPELASWKLCLGCIMRMDNLGTRQVLSPREAGSWRQAGDTVGRPGCQPQRVDPLFRDHTAQTQQLDTLTLVRPSEGGSMEIFLPILWI